MGKTVIRYLVNVLAAIVDESATIPSGVMDCIIDQFEKYSSVCARHHRVPSRAEIQKSEPTSGFLLIKDVCNAAPRRLRRPILAVSWSARRAMQQLTSQHFSEIQLRHGRDPTDEDLRELQKSHRMIVAMFRNTPDLLENTIPTLEENLRAVDEEPLRRLSTETLGEMLGVRLTAGGMDLSKIFPSVWRSWLGRRVDKSVEVRISWVKASKDILVHHPELRHEMQGESSPDSAVAHEQLRFSNAYAMPRKRSEHLFASCSEVWNMRLRCTISIPTCSMLWLVG